MAAALLAYNHAVMPSLAPVRSSYRRRTRRSTHLARRRISVGFTLGTGDCFISENYSPNLPGAAEDHYMIEIGGRRRRQWAWLGDMHTLGALDLQALSRDGVIMFQANALIIFEASSWNSALELSE